MTKEEIVIAELARNGAATAFELGAELEWPMRIASAHLTNLLCRGQVRHAGQIRVGRRLSYLYELAETGWKRAKRLEAQTA